MHRKRPHPHPARVSRRDLLRLPVASALAALQGVLGPEGTLAAAQGEVKALNLRVTDLRSWIVNHSASKNYVFCKVYTNQGIVGVGEGSVTSKAATMKTAIDEHRRYLVGRDPADIEMHWQAMYRWPRWRGGPILNSAISAVEIALWDILGQAVGQPIYRLLGGKARERVQMYVHPGGGPTPAAYAERWVAAREAGWTAGKGGFITTHDDVIEPVRSVGDGIANLRAVREAVGEAFAICIDVHGKATPTMASSFCRKAEPLDPYFVEEATQIEDLEELARLRAMTTIPLATGERLFTKYGFSQICHRHLVDYIQPDVVHCGGIMEMKKIAAIAEASRIELCPHNPQSEVSTLASLHVDFSTPNFAIQEISSGRRDQFWDDFFVGGGPKYEGGFALPPEGAGLGVTFDERVGERRPYVPVTRQQLRFPDGGIADH